MKQSLLQVLASQRRLRLPAGLLASAYVALKWHRVAKIWHETHWMHAYGDEIVADTRLRLAPPGALMDRAREIFLHHYTPRSGDVVVDVGAGVGIEAALFSRHVGPRGTVIAIEAHPSTFSCLSTVCRLSTGMSNTVPINVAAWDAPTVIGFTDGTLHTRNSVTQENSPAKLHVPALPLATVFDAFKLDRVNLLKMNIEGAELKALRGLGEWLPRILNLVVCCHDFIADQGGDPATRTLDSVQSLLLEHGFELTTRNDQRAAVRHILYARKRHA